MKLSFPTRAFQCFTFLVKGWIIWMFELLFCYNCLQVCATISYHIQLKIKFWLKNVRTVFTTKLKATNDRTKKLDYLCSGAISTKLDTLRKLALLSLFFTDRQQTHCWFAVKCHSQMFIYIFPVTANWPYRGF